jgi:hypothetical protein
LLCQWHLFDSVRYFALFATHGFFLLRFALAFGSGLVLTWLFFVSVVGGFILSIFLGKRRRFLWYGAIVYWVLFDATFVYFGSVLGYWGNNSSDTGGPVWVLLFLLFLIYGLCSILFKHAR